MPKAPSTPAMRFLGLLGRLPEPLLRAVLWPLSLLGFGLTGALSAMGRVFARVRGFRGEPAGPAEIAGIRRSFLRFYVSSLVNLCRICASGSPPKAPVAVELPALAEIERLRARGKGVILATPHFGDLYSGIIGLADAGLPLTVLMIQGEQYRPAEFKKLRFVEFFGGASECLAALRANGCVLVYADLDFVPGNRTADFFGGPAFPPHGPARLALETGAAILPVCAVWSADRTRVVAASAILPEGAGQEELEASVLRGLEELIGPRPDQWTLMYDPWDLGRARAAAWAFRARGAAAKPRD
jgi:phosphatidylinositol dimannoside acyltransferase